MFLCTFSSFSISDFSYGFHVGNAYSNPGLIIVLYKTVKIIYPGILISASPISRLNHVSQTATMSKHSSKTKS